METDIAAALTSVCTHAYEDKAVAKSLRFYVAMLL